MTVPLWRIATDTPDYEAHDLSGKGAEITGGRWNRPGRPILYTATNIALACLETLVHLNTEGLPMNRFLVRIDVPDEIWADRRTLAANALPVGWTATPSGKVSLDIGDAWLQSLATSLLVIPSVIVPEESCVLINSAHSDIAAFRATKVRPWLYDQRLVPS